jgi:hypothetical protein
MTTRNELITALTVIAGAFVAWGLWMEEVIWLMGWAGLAWLDEFNWSSLPISAVIMATSSYVVASRAGWRSRAIFIGLGSVLAVAAFAVVRWVAEHFFGFSYPMFFFFPISPIFGFSADPFVSFLEHLTVIVLVGILVAAGLPVLAHWCLSPVRVWTAPLLALGLILVLPLSVATIQVFPALNGSTDDVHAVKMGYPVFWTALVIPLALRIGLRQNARN